MEPEPPTMISKWNRKAKTLVKFRSVTANKRMVSVTT